MAFSPMGNAFYQSLILRMERIASLTIIFYILLQDGGWREEKQ
jgi:hypothetical protein